MSRLPVWEIEYETVGVPSVFPWLASTKYQTPRHRLRIPSKTSEMRMMKMDTPSFPPSFSPSFPPSSSSSSSPPPTPSFPAPTTTRISVRKIPAIPDHDADSAAGVSAPQCTSTPDVPASGRGASPSDGFCGIWAMVIQTVYTWLMNKILNRCEKYLPGDRQPAPPLISTADQDHTEELQRRVRKAETSLAVARKDLVWVNTIWRGKVQDIDELKGTVKDQKEKKTLLKSAHIAEINSLVEKNNIEKKNLVDMHTAEKKKLVDMHTAEQARLGGGAREQENQVQGGNTESGKRT